MLQADSLLLLTIIAVASWTSMVLHRRWKLRPSRRCLILFSITTLILAAALARLAWAIWRATQNDVWFRRIRTVEIPEIIGLSLIAVAILAGIFALKGRRTKGPTCPRCRYSMQGAPTLRCPECGHEAPDERSLITPARRPRLFLTSVAILIAATVLAATGRYHRAGPASLLPTTIIIAGLPWMPDSVLFGSSISDPEHTTLAGRVKGDQVFRWQLRWLIGKYRTSLMVEPGVKQMERAHAVLRGHGFDIYNFEMTYELAEMLSDLKSVPAQDVLRANELAQFCIASWQFASEGNLPEPFTAKEQLALAPFRERMTSLLLDEHHYPLILTDERDGSQRYIRRFHLAAPSQLVLLRMGDHAIPAMPEFIESSFALVDHDPDVVNTVFMLSRWNPTEASEVLAEQLHILNADPGELILEIYKWAPLSLDPIGPLLIEWIRTDHPLSLEATRLLVERQWQPSQTIPAILECARNSPYPALIFDLLREFHPEKLADHWTEIRAFADAPNPYVRADYVWIEDRQERWEQLRREGRASEFRMHSR